MLDAAYHADVVTVRNTIRWAVAGDDAGLSVAVALLDRVLRARCPPGRRAW